MSAYLGKDKVAVTYFEKANMYEDNRSIMQDDVYTPWVRPEGWPDLDSLNLEMSGEQSFIYMTYRTGHIDDVCAFVVNTVTGTATISLGTVTNGEFIATSTETVSNGTTKTYWFTSNEGYSDGTIVVKVTGRLSRFYLVNVGRASADGGGTIQYYMQPMLERIWYVPELISFNSGTTNGTNGNGTCTIERDKIANGNGNALISMYHAWYWCYKLLSLDINGLKTLNVTNMDSTFMYCRELENIDVSNFNTSKVTTIYCMFGYCNRVKQLDLSNWDTLKLTGSGLSYTFISCWALQEIIGLKDIYTNNLTGLTNTFNACYSLIDLSEIINWNISNVTNLSGVFSSCYKIKILDLSNWDVGKVTSVLSMFNTCRNLEHILFPKVQTAILRGSLASVFYLCYNLLEVDVSWFKPITNAVTNISYMFALCRSLSEINIPEGWDITGCIASDACYRVFSDCYKLLKITGISNWDMSNYNYSLAYSFEYDYCLKELDIKNWCPHPTSMYYAFLDCNSLLSIDLTGWHWENMTGGALGNIFANCHNLKEIKGIEHIGDSGNITSFASTFNGCYSLTSLPNISSWSPEKVTSCSAMFANCYSLQYLTIKNWSLPKCTTIANMFRYCYNMRELDLSGWSLPALTTVPDYIFCEMSCLQKCSGLPIGLNHRYQGDYSLPEDLWARIFTQLPTVSGKTLNISSVNINKLTNETKAIATNKGWTLVN